jgi:DNA-binding IclR family transcriptional regulator
VEARYLTSADVSRRLGVEGGTVRHYAEVLRGLGFPMDQDPGTGAYLWTPELVEVAHKKSFRSLPSRKSTRLAKRLSERPRLYLPLLRGRKQEDFISHGVLHGEGH